VTLLDPKWPAVIQKIQELPLNGQCLKAYGLPKIDVGSVGPIQNTQQWHNEELKNFDILFSPASEDVPNQAGHGAFEEGTFFTGKV